MRGSYIPKYVMVRILNWAANKRRGHVVLMYIVEALSVYCDTYHTYQLQYVRAAFFFWKYSQDGWKECVCV